jgi:hypothetical protein
MNLEELEEEKKKLEASLKTWIDAQQEAKNLFGESQRHIDTHRGAIQQINSWITRLTNNKAPSEGSGSAP